MSFFVKKNISNRFGQLILISTTLIAFHKDSLAITIKPGNPMFPKEGNTTVEYLLVCRRRNVSPTRETITINVNSNDNPLGKAIKIKDALDGAKLPPDCGGTLDLINEEVVLGNKVLLFKKTAGDDSGQKDEFKTGKGTSNPDPPKKIIVDGGVKVSNLSTSPLSELSGLDPDGNESIFFASLGFSDGINNITATSDFVFGDLQEPTIDNLLTNIFDDFLLDLPDVFKPNLTLDLASDEISLEFSNNIETASVQTQSTDTGGGLSQELQVRPVPENNSEKSIILISIMTLIFNYFRFLRKSNKASNWHR